MNIEIGRELTSSDLVDIHQIQQLKYRYIRAIDTHDWALIESCFAEDAQVWYADGAITRNGRAAIIDFFRAGISPLTYSSHIALHPEIALTGPDEAKAIWRFQDLVYTVQGADEPQSERGPRPGERAEGAGIYHDSYARVGGVWLIRSTGFVRLYEFWSMPAYMVTDSFGPHADPVLKYEPRRGGRRGD